MDLLEHQPLLNNETLLVVHQQLRNFIDALARSPADPFLGFEVDLGGIVQVLVVEGSQ